MSTMSVTLEKVTIEPHPNADALELAKVGEYRAVVPKGQYVTDDTVLYIPEQAVLPAEIISKLGLEGRLAGPKQDRVKPVRLRGELSQGIVCQPSTLVELDDEESEKALESKYDFGPDLGIEKWVPTVPASMAGEVEHASQLVRWIDIENIQRYPDIFSKGDWVVATEKVHGTCCLITYHVESGNVIISSKGLGSKNLVLKESANNVYWQAFQKENIRALLEMIAKEQPELAGQPCEYIGLFGEVYGPGIQDLHYGQPERRYMAFDCRVNWRGGKFYWVSQLNLHSYARECGVTAAPILYEGNFEWDALRAVATGPETISGKESHIREGVVIRSGDWDGVVDPPGDRPIGKLINPDYLTRKGGTEYE